MMRNNKFSKSNLNKNSNKFSQLIMSRDPQNLVLLGMMFLLFIGVSIISPQFFSFNSFKVMISNYALEGIMALGLTLVIISGGIDLSVAGVMPFSAIIYAFLIKSNINIYLSMLIIIIVAGALGFVNNFLRDLLNVHPFVVTLAMQLTLRGVNLVITNSDVITDFPAKFLELSQFKVFGFNIPVLVLIVLIIVYLLLLGKNRYFRYVYFVGNNPTAAEYSGINVKGFLRFIYVQSSVLAGIAGIMACFTYNSAHASYGIGIESRVITIVAVGGASMVKGGIGTIGGTVLGMLFMSMIYSAFIMSGISTYYQDVVTGLLLILAVVVGEKLKKRKHN